MDQKGFIFSLDVLLSLVVVIIILGISADAMDMAGNRIDDFCSEQSYQRIINDACDILIKTQGSPKNWEIEQSLTGVTPGLADTENLGTNKLSVNKLKSLKEHPELMEKLIPQGFKCCITLYPMDNSLPALSIVNQTPTFDTEVYVVNRSVTYSYFSYEIYSTLKIEKNLDENVVHYTCPHTLINPDYHERPDFNNKKSGWICDVFKVKPDNLDRTDFYLMTDNSDISHENAFWILDSPDDLSDDIQRFENRPMDVTDKIRDIKNSGVYIFHFYASSEFEKPFRVYIVGVPTGTPLDIVKVQYLGLKSGYFVFKMWN